MKRILLLACAASAACSHPAPVVAPKAADSPFVLPFTIGTPADSVRGRFVGVARMDGSWMRVDIDTAVVDIPPGRAERWRGLTISAFVAADYRAGDFRAPAKARPVNVFRFLDFSKTADESPRTLRVE